MVSGFLESLLVIETPPPSHSFANITAPSRPPPNIIAYKGGKWGHVGTLYLSS